MISSGKGQNVIPILVAILNLMLPVGCNQKPSGPGGGGNNTGETLAISGLAPTSGPAGTQVTISGNGFSATASENTVTFGGTGATVSSSSDTALVAVIPSGLSPGSVTLEFTTDEQTTTGPDFTVTGGGLSSEYPGDEGIEADPAVIFASGFNGGPGEWSGVDGSFSKIKTDARAAHSGSKYLQIRASGEVDHKFAGVDSVYLRFYTKLGKQTKKPHHFVHIQGYKDDYGYPGGTAGHKPDSAFSTTLDLSSDLTWHFYTYWYKMHSWQTPEGDPDGKPNPYYGNNFKPRGQQSSKRGEWICVEMYVKLNTPGESDGQMAFWINGRKIGRWKPGTPVGTWIRDRFVTGGPYNDNPHPFEGFDLRADAALKLKNIGLQWYLSDYENSYKNKVYFDDVVVATKYIGPQLSGVD